MWREPPKSRWEICDDFICLARLNYLRWYRLYMLAHRIFKLVAWFRGGFDQRAEINNSMCESSVQLFSSTARWNSASSFVFVEKCSSSVSVKASYSSGLIWKNCCFWWHPTVFGIRVADVFVYPQVFRAGDPVAICWHGITVEIYSTWLYYLKFLCQRACYCIFFPLITLQLCKVDFVHGLDSGAVYNIRF